MKIIVFGASGDVGRRVVAEALSRGHEVTAVARSAAKLAGLPEAVTKRVAEIADSAGAARLMAGQDLAVH